MTPAEMLTAMWGSSFAPLLAQIWTLENRRSYYQRSPHGAAMFDGAKDAYTCVALASYDYGYHKRAKADEAAAIAGMWLDIDIGNPGVPDRESAERIAQAVAPPTLLVDSGHGVHAWHLFERPWRFASREEQHTAAVMAAQWQTLHRRKTGASLDSVHDLARLMRLPGTLNAKDPADVVPARCVEHHDDRRYDPMELREQCTTVGRVSLRREDPLDRDLPLVDFKLGPGRAPPAALLDALIENSPEFRASWTHTGTRYTKDGKLWTTSEWEFSCVNIAAAAGWTDPQLADLIALHRRIWDPGSGKEERFKYVDRTLRMVRASARERAA